MSKDQDKNSETNLRSVDPFFSGRRHFLELDGLRGVAIGLVLVCHYFYWLIEPATNIYRKIALAFLGKAGNWGVTLFFVLSGFLISNRSRHGHKISHSS